MGEQRRGVFRCESDDRVPFGNADWPASRRCTMGRVITWIGAAELCGQGVPGRGDGGGWGQKRSLHPAGR